MEHKSLRLKLLSAFRADINEIALVAVVLTTGGSILATGIALSLPTNPLFISAFGGAIILIGFAAIAWKYRPLINGETRLRGVIFLDKETRNPISIPGYSVSNELSSDIKGLCAENKALGRIWTDSKFFELNGVEEGNPSFTKGPSLKLAEEALEYFTLSKLSVHLTDYFNDTQFNEKLIKTFVRNDIPNVLLNNRFIDLFSRPLEEREAFSSSHRDAFVGRIVYASGPSGEIFNDFDFTLPVDAKVERQPDNSVVISTSRFQISITASIDSASGRVPFHFISDYVGTDWSSVETSNFSLLIRVKVHPARMMSKTGWEYYNWLDSFLEKLEEDVDFGRFLDRIGWDHAVMIKRIIEHGLVKERGDADRTPT